MSNKCKETFKNYRECLRNLGIILIGGKPFKVSFGIINSGKGWQELRREK